MMTLGFTKSKAYFDFYFKVEGGIPVILQLYIDGVFQAS